MCPPMVELGAWAPDQPDVANGGMDVAFNTIPAVRGYDSMPSLITAGIGSLNSACLGALTGRSRNGTNFTVAGSATRLYLATSSTLSNVSNGGASPYTLSTGSSGNWWSFVLYGNRVIASSYADAPESFVIGSSSNFAALSADAPKAKHLAVVRDFIVAGNIIGRGVNSATIGTAEDAVQWSALDDPTSWPQVGTNAAKSVQSDWQPLAGNGGQVTDVVGGSDYGIVFQERAIWRMDYEGGDTFFRFTPIDENRGCSIHKAAIRVGGLTYFPAEDGFMATDGMQTVPIGNELVDRFFLDQFNQDSQAVLSCAYFPSWKCIVWLFAGQDSTPTLPNTLLIFNVQSSRWSYAFAGAEWLTESLPLTALTLDNDATSLDSGTYASVSLDSTAGVTRRSAAAFDASHTMATFTGPHVASILETKQFEPSPGRVGTVLSLRPVYDGTDATFNVLIKTRIAPGGSLGAVGTASVDTTGKYSTRATGRYMQASLVTSGEYRNLSGFDVEVVERGAR